jgi:hypothetical protein
MINIESVKLQSNGWLLNGTMSVPMADGNMEYEAIKQWIAEGNTPEPEFTQEELNQQAINKQIAEYQTYLNNTDHKMLNNYVSKANEDLNAIITQRNIARDYIRANQ